MTEKPNPTQRPPQPDRPYVVSLRLDARNAGTSDVAKRLRDKVGVKGDQSGQTANGRVRLYVIGQGALSAAAAANTKHDIAEAERWNLPIILIVLLAVFGSLAAAAIPLALGVCTVVVTMGLVYLLSAYTTMSVFVTSTVSMFGIALAVDYSLFILMRFREELRAGREPTRSRGRRDGHLRARGGVVRDDRHRLAHRDLPDQHPGAEIDGYRSDSGRRGRDADVDHLDAGGAGDVRPGGRQAVGAAALVAPAGEHPVPVLEPLGRIGDAPAVDIGAGGVGGAARSWRRRRHRWCWATACCASSTRRTRSAPGSPAASQALGPGALGPVQVLVSFPDGGASSPEHSQALAAIRQRMTQAPNIVSVTPPQFADDNSSALLSAVLSVDPEDMGARDTVDWMRAQLPKVPDAGTARVDVGGPTALIKDFDDRVSATEPLVLLFVALIAFVMLLISIHSVFLAFKGVLMTLLSVAAAYGSLVMVFQWGWLAGSRLRPDHLDR